MTDAATDAASQIHVLRGWRDPETFHAAMRDDPTWAVMVRFVCEHGIPMSEFLGRVARPGEPRWTAWDRQVAVEYTRWSGQVCQGCGLHPLDWPNERDETHAGVIDKCHGCAELADARSTIPDDVSDERRSAMRVHLRRRSRRELELLEAMERGDIEWEDIVNPPHLT